MSKLFCVLGLSGVALVASMTLLTDPFLQIFAVWAATQLILQQNFCFQLNPLKVLALVGVVVAIIGLGNKALKLGIANGDIEGQLERFIVDWGISGSPLKCGGNTDDNPPTHTAVSDIWSDPETIIDQRIDRVLEATKHQSRETDAFLNVDVPNARSNTEADIIGV